VNQTRSVFSFHFLPDRARPRRRSSVFGEIVALFALSAFIAYLCTRIRLVPIVGFLLTGVVVGPNALGLVQDPELVSTLVEIGGILLLFEIGIEFSLSKLARLKRAIGLGTAWLVNLAGGSLELGAFLAGLVVSESEYSEQALSEVLPFRSLFNAIYFVSEGTEVGGSPGSYWPADSPRAIVTTTLLWSDG
jgi:Kef-type K+ transport system membrane component KefB